jgi:hypothetical protein
MAGVFTRAQIQSRYELDTSLETILCHVEDLGKVARMLDGFPQPHPGSRLQCRRLLYAEQVWHVLDVDKLHLGSGVDVHDAVKGHDDVGLSGGLDVDVSLHY